MVSYGSNLRRYVNKYHEKKKLKNCVNANMGCEFYQRMNNLQHSMLRTWWFTNTCVLRHYSHAILWHGWCALCRILMPTMSRKTNPKGKATQVRNSCFASIFIFKFDWKCAWRDDVAFRTSWLRVQFVIIHLCLQQNHAILNKLLRLSWEAYHRSPFGKRLSLPPFSLCETFFLLVT